MPSFIMAGRVLQEPLEMHAAICRAVHKRPSMDVTYHYAGAAGLTRVLPWPTRDEALAACTQEMVVTEVLLKMLRAGDLRTYVLNPKSRAYMLVGREYWNQQDQEQRYVLRAMPDAAGWEAAMEGQPILVAAEDLPAWEKVADDAAASKSPISSSAPLHKRRSKDRPERTVLRKFIKELALPNEWMTEGSEHYRTQEVLHGGYVTFCRNRRPPVKPYELSGFKKWLTKFNQGEWD